MIMNDPSVAKKQSRGPCAISFVMQLAVQGKRSTCHEGGVMGPWGLIRFHDCGFCDMSFGDRLFFWQGPSLNHVRKNVI